MRVVLDEIWAYTGTYMQHVGHGYLNTYKYNHIQPYNHMLNTCTHAIYILHSIVHILPTQTRTYGRVVAGGSVV